MRPEVGARVLYRNSAAERDGARQRQSDDCGPAHLPYHLACSCERGTTPKKITPKHADTMSSREPCPLAPLRRFRSPAMTSDLWPCLGWPSVASLRGLFDANRQGQVVSRSRSRWLSSRWLSSRCLLRALTNSRNGGRGTHAWHSSCHWNAETSKATVDIGAECLHRRSYQSGTDWYGERCTGVREFVQTGSALDWN